MGMDCYAYAAWGLKLTRKDMESAYIEERTWVGAEGAPRTEFDPTTGKPNYRVTTKIPDELEDRALSIGSYDDDEVVIPLRQATTGSHRRGTRAVPVSAEPSQAETAAFRSSMQSLGLWEKGEYGHWLFLYISV